MMNKILFYSMAGEKMCFQHILFYLTYWIWLLTAKAKNAGLIAGVCFACSKVLGVYEQNLNSGLSMLTL